MALGWMSKRPLWWFISISTGNGSMSSVNKTSPKPSFMTPNYVMRNCLIQIYSRAFPRVAQTIFINQYRCQSYGTIASNKQVSSLGTKYRLDVLYKIIMNGSCGESLLTIMINLSEISSLQAICLCWNVVLRSFQDIPKRMYHYKLRQMSTDEILTRCPVLWSLTNKVYFAVLSSVRPCSERPDFVIVTGSVDIPCGGLSCILPLHDRTSRMAGGLGTEVIGRQAHTATQKTLHPGLYRQYCVRCCDF